MTPDFDAAVADFAGAVADAAALRMQVTTYGEVTAANTALLAARQRVREVYEAVVRERDAWCRQVGLRDEKLADLRAAQQGEVYEVQWSGGCCTSPEVLAVNVDDSDLKPGDRVRVTRVEGAA